MDCIARASYTHSHTRQPHASRRGRRGFDFSPFFSADFRSQLTEEELHFISPPVPPVTPCNASFAWFFIQALADFDLFRLTPLQRGVKRNCRSPSVDGTERDV